MIGGCEQEREFKMNVEPGSLGLGSDGTGCSEGLYFLEMYFGQSNHHCSIPNGDRLLLDGMGDKSDQMELDSELSSILFGREEDPLQTNQIRSSRVESEGFFTRNPTSQDSFSCGSSTGNPGLVLTGSRPEWRSSQLETCWNWPNERDSYHHPTASKEDWIKTEVKETGAGTNVELRKRGRGRRRSNGISTTSSIGGNNININMSTDIVQTNPLPFLLNECSAENFDKILINNKRKDEEIIEAEEKKLKLNYLNNYQTNLIEINNHNNNSLYNSNNLNPKIINSLPIEFNQIYSNLTNSVINPIDHQLQILKENDHQNLIDLEFHRWVVEEQCAPSTPISTNSSSNLILNSKFNHQNPNQRINQNLINSNSIFSIDLLTSLFPTTSSSSSSSSDQTNTTTTTTPIYLNQPTTSTSTTTTSSSSSTTTTSLKLIHDELNDNFSELINSNFDLCPSPSFSTPCHSISSSALPPPFFNPFFSDSPTSTTQLTTTIDSSLISSQLQTPPLVEHHSHHPFEPSITSTSSLPSPSTLSHPTVSNSHSTPRTPPSNHSVVNRPIQSRNTSDSHHDNPSLHRSQSHPALTKSNIAAAELPTEVELAIPRLGRLNLSEPCPDDIQLFLLGLRAQGAKTRVETQIKVTLVLMTGNGGSIDRNGNLLTENQHTLTRIGNWSHIKLPVYSAIKRKSKKLIKTGIPPEETLFLDVAVIRASEPHEEIYCCSNCQAREQKRTQRKRDARVRPAQEIESDEAEQSIRPEDEKRKIVVFNCGQYVNFESGEVTLPTRITCYCRHHREKKGFRVKVTLRDHTNRLIATSITPAIMITDDHKAVAAAAKAKSGSDVEDNQPRGRLIRRLPSTGLQTTASAPRRGKKKLLCPSIEFMSDHQIASESTEDKDRYDSPSGWVSSPQNGPGCIFPRSQSSTRSTSTNCKRKAPSELSLC